MPEHQISVDEATTQSAPVAVVGVGNMLMGDDGVGVAVIRELGKERLPRGVELYDAGTALSDVLALIAPRARVILVDSCRAGGTPGNVYRSRVGPDEWEAGPVGASLHEVDAVGALQLYQVAGGKLGEVVLIGVEPQEVALRDGLSPALQARLPAIVAAVREEIESLAEGRRGGRE